MYSISSYPVTILNEIFIYRVNFVHRLKSVDQSCFARQKLFIESSIAKVNYYRVNLNFGLPG
jgi:hypothetical protein